MIPCSSTPDLRHPNAWPEPHEIPTNRAGMPLDQLRRFDEQAAPLLKGELPKDLSGLALRTRQCAELLHDVLQARHPDGGTCIHFEQSDAMRTRNDVLRKAALQEAGRAAPDLESMTAWAAEIGSMLDDALALARTEREDQGCIMDRHWTLRSNNLPSMQRWASYLPLSASSMIAGDDDVADYIEALLKDVSIDMKNPDPKVTAAVWQALNEATDLYEKCLAKDEMEGPGQWYAGGATVMGDSYE